MALPDPVAKAPRFGTVRLHYMGGPRRGYLFPSFHPSLSRGSGIGWHSRVQRTLQFIHNFVATGSSAKSRNLGGIVDFRFLTITGLDPVAPQF
jgi:hypothetical protein